MPHLAVTFLATLAAVATRQATQATPSAERSLLDLLLNVGSIAGLVSIFLAMHQSRRNRPALSYTSEGYSEHVWEKDQRLACDFRFMGLIRNASLIPNTIVRLYLVAWKNDAHTQSLSDGHGGESIKDLATGQMLTLPLRMEGRSAIHVEIDFGLPLTGTHDLAIMNDVEIVRRGNLEYRQRRHHYDICFEDAAGNYFDHNGRLLSRELINMHVTLTHFKGWARTWYLCKIGWSWVRWNLTIVRSWFGFYK